VLESKTILHSLTRFSFSKDIFLFDDTTAFFKDSSSSCAINDNDDDFSAGDGFNTGNNDALLPVLQLYDKMDYFYFSSYRFHSLSCHLPLPYLLMDRLTYAILFLFF
jgi:hypothetical protein